MPACPSSSKYLPSDQAFSTINNHSPLPTGYIDWGYLDLNLNAVSKSVDFETNQRIKSSCIFFRPIFSRIIR